jgi:hypothetical protein
MTRGLGRPNAHEVRGSKRGRTSDKREPRRARSALTRVKCSERLRIGRRGDVPQPRQRVAAVVRECGGRAKVVTALRVCTLSPLCLKPCPRDADRRGVTRYVTKS